ncbi:MAG: hypothetical protein LBD29_00340 [Treponema sp.]|jgi:flavodoxin|nr:hypothetical protein [Treponema sp.]
MEAQNQARKILVPYFSWSGNANALAGQIAGETSRALTASGDYHGGPETSVSAVEAAICHYWLAFRISTPKLFIKGIKG